MIISDTVSASGTASEQASSTKTSSHNTINRREFLKVTTLAGVGFAIGTWFPAQTVVADDKHKDSVEASAGFGHFVRVSADNTVTVVIKHLDKGQGVTTGLTAIVAEELDADWEQMRWAFAPADAKRYNNLLWGPYQGTGGSTAIANSWQQLREAGAGAKSLLKQAAAKAWQVPESEIKVESGVLSHASGKKAKFGEFAVSAAGFTVPKALVLKTPKEFRLIGTHMPRIDSPDKSTGRAQYTIDVRLPGMLTAVLQRPPVFGAKVKSFDDSAAKKIAGVKAVVQTPRGVAVVAENYWAATQGRQALQVSWDDSSAEKRSSAELWSEFKALAEKPGVPVRNEGDVDKIFGEKQSQKEKTFTLDFEFPFLAHCTMEPMNAVVQLDDASCQVWTGSQLPTVDQYALSLITGLSPEKIKIHTQLAGGSFGRRAVPDSDYVAEAAYVAKALNNNKPVCVQWTREDDVQGGRYRPMAFHKFMARVNDQGQILAWQQRIVSQPILRGTPFEAMIQGPIDFTIVEGGRTLPYEIPNLRVDAHEAQAGVPVLWWRSVGHTHNAYATEVFLDELAHLTGQDPFKLRQSLLKNHPRHLQVLNLVAEKAKWGRKMPQNQAQGIAFHESFGSFVAQVAEVTLNKDKSYQVDKIFCAVDCGIAISPDIIKAQMEGGIGYGLSAAMGEAITFKDGRVQESNFHDYPLLRIDKMPDIEVFIVPSTEAPTGVGEPGTPPAGPAVANALRALLEKPLVRLPWGAKLV